MSKFSFLMSATALVAVTTPALAGGTAAAPAPADPVVIAAPAPVMDWTGAYGAVLLGYGQGTYGNDNNFPGDGEADWDGALYGLALGYNFQNGNMVYGGELTWSGADVSGSEECVNPAFQCYGSIDSIATLRGRVGYLVQPQTMVYGTLGFAQANITFGTTNGAGAGGEQSRDVGGYVVGLGVEHAFTDRINLRAAILHYQFDEDDYQTDVLYNDIDGDLTEIELGVVFRF